ncbi:MAG: hypothetical protein WDA32_00530 [Candidatus Caldatribacteriota bacterium]
MYWWTWPKLCYSDSVLLSMITRPLEESTDYFPMGIMGDWIALATQHTEQYLT